MLWRNPEILHVATLGLCEFPLFYLDVHSSGTELQLRAL
jgi:hypothetical protein